MLALAGLFWLCFIQGVSLCLWYAGWVLCAVSFCLVVLFGLLVGTQVYINRQARTSQLGCLAVHLHMWALACSIWPLLSALRVLPQGFDVGLKEVVALVLAGTKVFSDVQDKILDHQGQKLSVFSACCLQAGIKWAAYTLQPLLGWAVLCFKVRTSCSKSRPSRCVRCQ
jgi:hypothetical protein